MRYSVIKTMGHDSLTWCELLDVTEYVGVCLRPNCGLFPSVIESAVVLMYTIFASCVNAPGYSVAVVHTEYGPLYVAGAPRHSMRGKVLVFQDGRLKQTLQGEQVLCFTRPGAGGSVGVKRAAHISFDQTAAVFSPPDTLTPFTQPSHLARCGLESPVCSIMLWECCKKS